MKKWIAALSVAAMVLAGASTAGASPGGSSAAYQACSKIPNGLLQALRSTANKELRTAIYQAIYKYQQQCVKDRKDDDARKLTAAERVKKDVAALSPGYAEGDSQYNITRSITLPAKGKYGSTITWKSDKPGIIADSGKLVKRPDTNDAVFELRATVRYGNATLKHNFTLKVIGNPMSATQRVAKDQEALTLRFNGTDTAAAVTQALKALPVKGKYGSTIQWLSGNTGIISNDGRTVVRPVGGDAVVPLTAIITYGPASTVKVFTVTVKAQLSDAQKLAADKQALAIDFGGSDTAASVTRAFDALPAKGKNGTTIVWMSSLPSVISNTGQTVHRPAAGSADATVVLTAVLTNGSLSDIKTFTVTVKADYTATQRVAADKADLAVGYAKGDSADQVTQSVKLPVKGAGGSTIQWFSSASNIVDAKGNVHRPAKGKGDATVTLTAFIQWGGVGDVKTFTLVVRSK